MKVVTQYHTYRSLNKGMYAPEDPKGDVWQSLTMKFMYGSVELARALVNFNSPTDLKVSTVHIGGVWRKSKLLWLASFPADANGPLQFRTIQDVERYVLTQIENWLTAAKLQVVA